jgi:hypothetical protein
LSWPERCFAALADEIPASVQVSRHRNARIRYGRFERARRPLLAAGSLAAVHAILAFQVRLSQALRARPRRRGPPKDAGERSAIADNVLDRQFTANAPNQKWVRQQEDPSLTRSDPDRLPEPDDEIPGRKIGAPRLAAASPEAFIAPAWGAGHRYCAAVSRGGAPLACASGGAADLDRGTDAALDSSVVRK